MGKISFVRLYESWPLYEVNCSWNLEMESLAFHAGRTIPFYISHPEERSTRQSVISTRKALNRYCSYFDKLEAMNLSLKT